MKPETLQKPFDFEKLFAYGVVPLAAALLFIAKVFIIPGCYAFDANDDVSYPFCNLLVARAILRSGEIPMMNLFNNFGMPMIGDCLTFPFAPHAWTYVLFPDFIAMTVNRFVFAFLSIAVLTVYYKRYVSYFSASVCALLTLTAPGYLQHLAHHQYQTILFYFPSLLLIQVSDPDFKKIRSRIIFYVLFVMLVLSTHIHVILICGLSLAIHQWFLAEKKMRATTLVLIVMAAGVLFYAPDILSLFSQARHSIRLMEGFDLPTLNMEHLLLCLIGANGGSVNALHKYVNFPLPIVSASVIGVYLLVSKKSTHPLAWRVGVLGFLPFILIFTLLAVPGWTRFLPYLAATDITRPWWISSVFMMIPVGILLDRIEDTQKIMDSKFSLIVTGVHVLIGFVLLLTLAEDFLVYAMPSFLFLVLSPFFIKHITKRPGTSPPRETRIKALLIYASLVCVLLYSRTPLSTQILGLADWSRCRTSHWYSDRSEAVFQPDYFLKFIEPYSRVASEFHPSQGYDFRLSKAHIFGSMGRQALLDNAFTRYLKRSDLIHLEEHPAPVYYFKSPWDKEKLASLGIKYVVQKDRNRTAEQDGWKLAAQVGYFFLYRNPENISVIYLLDGEKRRPIPTSQMLVEGNGLRIELPALEEENTLVATFVARPDWQAAIDGRPVKINKEENQLIRVAIKPGDKQLVLKYAPFGVRHYLLGILGSLALFSGACFGIKK